MFWAVELGPQYLALKRTESANRRKKCLWLSSSCPWQDIGRRRQCRSLAALLAPFQVRFILWRSSLNDVRSPPCLLWSTLVHPQDSGIQIMATHAGLTSSNLSRPYVTCHLSLQVCTISDRACIPDLLINSSLVTRSCHDRLDSLRIFRIHRRWNTSRPLRILAVDFHVSHACSAVDTIDV